MEQEEEEKKEEERMKVHAELDECGLLTLNKALALSQQTETKIREKCEGFLFHFLLLFQ